MDVDDQLSTAGSVAGLRRMLKIVDFRMMFIPVKRLVFICVTAALVGAALAQEVELPKPEKDVPPTESLDIEPPLLIDGNTLEPLPDLGAVAPTAAKPDVARLELQLQTAKRSAAAGGRLFKSGVLSKVEMEARALRVIRLQSDLENARLARAQEEADTQRARFDARETSPEDVEKVRIALAQATEAARIATDNRHRAELAAAEVNVKRQKQLLASGVGRTIDVKRAEEKLATLRQNAVDAAKIGQP